MMDNYEIQTGTYRGCVGAEPPKAVYDPSYIILEFQKGAIEVFRRKEVSPTTAAPTRLKVRKPKRYAEIRVECECGASRTLKIENISKHVSEWKCRPCSQKDYRKTLDVSDAELARLYFDDEMSQESLARQFIVSATTMRRFLVEMCERTGRKLRTPAEAAQVASKTRARLQCES